MCTGFLWLQRAEATPGCGVQAYGGGFSMGVSGNLWIVVMDVKTLVVYDVE